MRHSKGFTLLELMISLTIGLMISAALLTMYLSAVKTTRTQMGQSSIHDGANFGVDQITQSLRLAHLEAISANLTDQSVNGGIVLTSLANTTDDTIGVNFPRYLPANVATKALMSGTGLHDSNVSLTESGSELKSDQIVIQYLPVEIGGVDCQGNKISNTSEYVIERYFLSKESIIDNEPGKPLALVCDAGRYQSPADPTQSIQFTNYGLKDSNDIPAVIINRVDHLRILLGIEQDRTSGTTKEYVSVEDYLKFPSMINSPRPRITSVQFGALVRSTLKGDLNLESPPSFDVLDQKVFLIDNSTDSKNYLRESITQTIALRNAIGIRGVI